MAAATMMIIAAPPATAYGRKSSADGFSIVTGPSVRMLSAGSVSVYPMISITAILTEVL